MSLFTNFPVSLIDPKKQSAGNVKILVNQIAAESKQLSGPQSTLLGLGATMGENLQSQINTIFNALRSPIPLPPSFGLKDPSGRVIAQFGFQADGNAQNYGLTVFDLLGNVAGFVGVQTELPQTITLTSNANPDVITLPAHGYVNGDTILVAGALGDTAINGIRIVENATVSTFTMTDLQGAVIAGSGAYVANSGTAQRYYGGGAFQQIIIGGNQQIRAFADGRVVIQNTPLTFVAPHATITINPSSGGSTVGTIGVDIHNDSEPTAGVVGQSVRMSDTGFWILGSDGVHYIADMTGTADNGAISVSNLTSTKTITIRATVPAISITDASTNNTTLNAAQIAMSTVAGLGSLMTATELDTAVLSLSTTLTVPPLLTVGDAGSQQVIIDGVSIQVQTNAAARFVHISSQGSANGLDLGGTVWAISGGAGVSGTDATGAWALNSTNGLKINANAVIDGALNFTGNNVNASTGVFKVAGTQVVAARKTGWTLPTGTLSRAAFDQSTVTLPVLAQHVAALITDLFNQHGLIGT